MKRIFTIHLLCLIGFLVCYASGGTVNFKVNGIAIGDKAVVSIGSDKYLKTMDINTDGDYSFTDVPAGNMFIKIEASGYNLPQAQTVIINEDGTVKPEVGIKLVITKMDSDPNVWNHTWEEDPSISGYVTTAGVNKRPEIEFLGKKIVPSDVPSVGMLYNNYHIILVDEEKSWTQEYAYRLLETLKTIPYNVGDSFSKFILTDKKIENDITIEKSGNSRIVTIGEDAFYYANPFLVNLDGVRGRFFSKRLHHALVNYATNYGEDEDQVEKIISDRYGCSIRVPDYKALTAGITNEDEACFQKFHPTELVAIINMFEEMPDGFHKIPHLNYLIRRQNGHDHPLYPASAAVSWCVDNGYIEFMEKAFGGNNQQFDTQRLILHEKTHFLWDFSFSDQIKNDWIKVGGWYEDPNAAGGWSTTKDTEFVTAYAHGTNPNEDMAESVAYYIKNPDLLMSRSKEKYEFIRDRIMNGTRYISQIPEHLTFEVLNLNPDYDYPGKIKKLNVKIVGAPDEDKIATVEIELNHIEGFEDGASSGHITIYSPMFYDSDGVSRIQDNGTWLTPVDGNPYLLRGEMQVNKFCKSGYWSASDISLTDIHGNQRFEGRNDFVWNFYVNNPLEDTEGPKYEKGSLKYILTDTIIEGHKAQKLTSVFKVSDNVGVRDGGIRLGRAASGNMLYSFGDTGGKYDPNKGTISVDYIIPEYYATADYYVEFFTIFDLAGNTTSVNFSDSPLHEPRKTIHIVTSYPDIEAPEIDLNRMSVYAEPTNKENPDGETKVTINYYVRDNISGYNIGSYKLRSPQGTEYFEYHYIPGTGTMYFDGDPTAWKKYTINCILPKGSAPGIWGLSELSLTDKALNNKIYNFVETLIFEPDDDITDYILFTELEKDQLILKLTDTENAGYSYGYRIIQEDTGQEIDGVLTNAPSSRATNADYWANIDLSSMPDGNFVAIVQVRDNEGKPVAVRSSKFVKKTTTDIENAEKAANLRVVTGHGTMTFTSDVNQTVRIYNLNGTLFATAYLKGGEYKINIPAGIYVVNKDKHIVK